MWLEAEPKTCREICTPHTNLPPPQFVWSVVFRNPEGQQVNDFSGRCRTDRRGEWIVLLLIKSEGKDATSPGCCRARCSPFISKNTARWNELHKNKQMQCISLWACMSATYCAQRVLTLFRHCRGNDKCVTDICIYGNVHSVILHICENVNILCMHLDFPSALNQTYTQLF